MKKKILSLVVISMIIFTTMIASGQSNVVTKQNTNEIPGTLSDISESKLVKQTTLETITEDMQEYIDQLSCSPIIKQFFIQCIKQGLNDLKKQGINSEVSTDTLSLSSYDEKKAFGNSRTRFFIFNSYPDTVQIETTIPPLVENRTDNSTLEIFIKLYPVVDNIKTSKQMIVRTLTQETSVIWPCIGARIVEDNTTTSFIIAFGPAIKWSWSLF